MAISDLSSGGSRNRESRLGTPVNIPDPDKEKLANETFAKNVLGHPVGETVAADSVEQAKDEARKALTDPTLRLTDKEREKLYYIADNGFAPPQSEHSFGSVVGKGLNILGIAGDVVQLGLMEALDTLAGGKNTVQISAETWRNALMARPDLVAEAIGFDLRDSYIGSLAFALDRQLTWGQKTFDEEGDFGDRVERVLFNVLDFGVRAALDPTTYAFGAGLVRQAGQKALRAVGREVAEETLERLAPGVVGKIGQLSDDVAEVSARAGVRVSYLEDFRLAPRRPNLDKVDTAKINRLIDRSVPEEKVISQLGLSGAEADRATSFLRAVRGGAWNRGADLLDETVPALRQARRELSERYAREMGRAMPSDLGDAARNLRRAAKGDHPLADAIDDLAARQAQARSQILEIADDSVLQQNAISHLDSISDFDELVDVFGKLRKAEEASIKYADMLRGLDRVGDDIYNAYAQAVAFKDLSQLPADLVERAPRILSGGLLIGNPLTGRVAYQVPGTLGIVSKHTRRLRELRQKALHSGAALNRLYNAYRKTRTQLSHNYALADRIRHATPGSDEFAKIANQVALYKEHPVLAWRAAISTTANALERELERSTDAETIRPLWQGLTRLIGVGFDLDGAGVTAFRDRVEALRSLGRYTDEEIETMVSIVARIQPYLDDAKRMILDRFPETDLYLNYSPNILSDGAHRLINHLVRQGGALTRDDVEKSVGHQLLALVMESAQNTTGQAPIIGANLTSKRNIGVGMVSAIPLGRLRLLLDKALESADSDLEDALLALRESLEGGFLDVVTMNDLMEPAVKELVERHGIKIPRDLGANIRIWEENPLAALDRYADHLAEGIRVHDLKEIAKRHGSIISGDRYANVGAALASLSDIIGKNANEIRARQVKETGAREAIVTELKGGSGRITVGRGPAGFSVSAPKSVLEHPDVKKVVDRARRKVAAMDNSRAQVEDAINKTASALRRAGVDPETAELIARSQVTEPLASVRAFIDAYWAADQNLLDELAVELAAHIGDEGTDLLLGTLKRTMRTRDEAIAAVEAAQKSVSGKLTTDVSVDALLLAPRYLNTIVDGAGDAYLTHRIYQRARNALRHLDNPTAAQIEEKALNLVVQDAHRLGMRLPPETAKTAREALDSYSATERREMARRLSQAKKYVDSFDIDDLSEVGARYARKLKNEILETYNFGPKQLERLAELPADGFDDAFFTDPAVRRALGSKELSKLIQARKIQASRAVLAANVDNTLVRIGGEKVNVATVRRVVDRITSGQFDLTDLENQKVLELWLREIGHTGRFFWSENGVRVVKDVKDLVGLRRYQSLVDRASQVTSAQRIIREASSGNLKKAQALMEQNRSALSAAGLLKPIEDLLREHRLLAGVGTTLDHLIDSHSAYIKLHNTTLDRGYETVRRSIEDQIELTRSQLIANIPENTPTREAADALLDTLEQVQREILSAGANSPVLIPVTDPRWASVSNWMREVRKNLRSLGLDDAADELAGDLVRSRAITEADGFIPLRALNIDGPEFDVQLIEKGMAPFMEAVVHNSMAIYTPEGMSALKASLHTIQRVWKTMSTVWRPSFHVRNLVGGTWNSMIAGVGPASYARYSKPALAFHAALREGLSPTEAAIRATKDKEIRAKLLVANERRIFSTSFVSTEFRGVRSASARQQGMFDPRHERFIISQVGGSAMEMVEDMHRFTVFAKHYDPSRPATAELAADLVYAVHFDYSDPSLATTRIKNIAPFFVWTKNNIPLQAQLLLEQPRMISLYSDLLNQTERTLSSDSSARYDQFGKPKYLPYFHAETDIVINPGTPYWARVLIAPDIPLNDILNLEPTSAAGWASAFESSLSPLYTIMQTFLEQQDWGNVDSFGGTRIHRATRGALETALPMMTEYSSYLGLEQDPQRQTRYYINPDDPWWQRSLRGVAARLGKAAIGVTPQVPADSYSRSYEARDIVREIRKEALLRYGRE